VIARLREIVGAVSFHRGLALGALVGSAIAGSTIWARIREARTAAETNEDDVRRGTVPETAGSGELPGHGADGD
jgi:hypothetical protein